MLNLTLDLSEGIQLLDLVPREFKRRIRRAALRKGAAIIGKRARQLAPYDRGRRAGVHLRKGIIWQENKRTGEWIIGTKHTIVPHAHLVEYGTVKMSARPFFYPAYAETKEQVERVIADEIRRRIEEL